MVWRIPLFILICVGALGRITHAQDAESKPDDDKVKKEFYSAKDRLEAMRGAALFVPKAVGQADIMEGPAQNKKQFQLHFNDKVICDFATPGSKMGGKTPKFACKITGVESGVYDLRLTLKDGRTCFARNVHILLGKAFTIEDKDLKDCSNR